VEAKSQRGAKWYAPDATEHKLSATVWWSGARSAECLTSPAET